MTERRSTRLQLAVPQGDERPCKLIASVSSTRLKNRAESVLIWSTSGRCRAPLARILMADDDAVCVALEESAALCVVGFASGSLRLVELDSLKVAAAVRVHSTQVSCIMLYRGDHEQLFVISAASDGQVELLALEKHVAEVRQAIPTWIEHEIAQDLKR